MGQRQHPRIPLQVEVELESEHNFYTGLSRDLSEGGIFVATPQPPAIGDQVAFDLVLDGKSFHLSGVVIWIRPESVAAAGTPAGCGIKWLTLDGGALDAIRAFAAKRETDFYEE